ncbi:MAG TPA: hypothetical protein VLW84_13735 [Terriglobales bacterium]|nr:hypothetical protein [Terriglobales bacterium]
MHTEAIQSELLVTLADRYEHDPAEFVTLPKHILDSSSARVALAELRNDGFVEEQVRGVIRLTSRGYKAYKTKPLVVC